MDDHWKQVWEQSEENGSSCARCGVGGRLETLKSHGHSTEVISDRIRSYDDNA